MRYISNSYNLEVCYERYKYDLKTLERLLYAFESLRLDLPTDTKLVKVIHRTRRMQTVESLTRLQQALIPCEHDKWLEEKRRITEYSSINSLDFSKLKITDLYDFYIIPDDYYLDKYSCGPVLGPVFPDYRNSKLAGICIRNLSQDLEYVSDVKYTFSNFGWYLYGFDDYDSEDEVFIVEGVFDAISMRSAGYKAIAVGSSCPSPMQLSMLYYKYKHLRLCLDNDMAGCVGAYKIKSIIDIPAFIPVGMKDVSQFTEEQTPIKLIEVSVKDLKCLISHYKNNISQERDLRYNIQT